MENQNSYQEVTTEGWGSRLMGSIKSVLFGILLFFGSFVVIWWNEGRAVRTAKGLDEGASQVVSIDANSATSASDGKLVHVTGKVVTEDLLKDDEFGIEVNALKLRRQVVMYQWVEEEESKKEKQVGGSEKTTTTYNYEKKWVSNLVNSGDFKVSEGHMNPKAFPYGEYTHQVSNASLGNFAVSQSLLSKINNFNAFSIDKIDTGKVKKATILEDAVNKKQNIYIGEGTNADPQIGDVKLTFQIVEPGDYSIVAKQVGNTFEKFNTSTGTSIEMVSAGIFSQENMFQAAQKSNTITTWIFRLVGFLVMFFGLTLIFKPLVVLADVLPFLGNLLSMGLSFFSGIVALSLSLATMAIAWIFYRPVLGISLLIVGIGMIIFFYIRSSKKKKLVAATVSS